MFDLTGKVALVTGSTTGLGKSMALHLGRAGAKVALNYAHNVERAETTLAEFEAEGLTGALFRGSVIDPDSVTRLEEEIRESPRVVWAAAVPQGQVVQGRERRRDRDDRAVETSRPFRTSESSSSSRSSKRK